MELTKLLDSVKVIHLIGEVQRKDVSSIVYDSRNVKSNSVFVAIKGYNTDGHRFILDAINKGALAIILEDNNALPDDIFIHRKVAKILVKNSRKALAEISKAYYKDPSSKLQLIGITGTNGKTTTTYIIKKIIEASGAKAGLIGTIAGYIGETRINSKLTTPESNDLNELLHEMVSAGCQYAVMEVSSHSLFLNRVYGLNYSTAIFSNLTMDHLDFHGSFEDYFEAKKILFDNLEPEAAAIYNIDDPYGKRIVEDCRGKSYSYGKSEGADFLITDLNYNLSGTNFNIIWNNNSYPVSAPLIGEFNAYNITAGFASSVLSGISPEVALNGIKSIQQIPGRFEVISKENKKVIIDYSHTPDSLKKALETINKLIHNERIHTVFGCGGDRDRVKRPEMGNTASSLSDKVIVTSDNPRNEDPFNIINDIVAGIKKDNYLIIENREEAIKEAILNSEDDAVILVAGKGHEDYQEIKGVRNKFSDKEIAGKYLNL
jgi:UDP-N-acetylmuramoyl-L-alanyl-D-glutamate--2,6-diaminopimelate ligase